MQLTPAMKQRGWVPVSLKIKTYERLGNQLLVDSETWDSVISRLLDIVEKQAKEKV